jgi:CHAT domain-containing protein/tetratricopeptide (TPR) repeat protein
MAFLFLSEFFELRLIGVCLISALLVLLMAGSEKHFTRPGNYRKCIGFPMAPLASRTAGISPPGGPAPVALRCRIAGSFGKGVWYPPLHMTRAVGDRAVNRIIIVALALGLAGPAPTQSPQAPREAGTLQLHQPAKRDLTRGQTDVFTLEVPSGRFVRVVAQKNGVDVVLSVAGPAGNPVLTADSPSYGQGPEPAAWISSASGAYSVTVTMAPRSWHKGSYAIELTDLREPAENDRSFLAAQDKLYAAAVKDRATVRESRLDAIQLYEEDATLWRTLSDSYSEALCLHRIGAIQSDLGEQQKALDYDQRALTLRRAIGDSSGEAGTLNNIGLVYYRLGDAAKALDFYQQSLALRRADKDAPGEALTLNNIAFAHFGQGDHQRALEDYRQLLALQRANGDRSGEAATLANTGAVYQNLGEPQQALDSFEQALAIRRADGDRSGEAAVLQTLGNVYIAAGEPQKSLDTYDKVLAIRRAVGDQPGQASTLGLLGSVYSILGETGKALDYYQQQLALARAANDRPNESNALMGLGDVYCYLGEKQKSLEAYLQSTAIDHAAGNRAGEALSLIGIANTYVNLGGRQKGVSPSPAEMQQALDEYLQALATGRALGDPTVQVFALMGAGVTYSALNDKPKALEHINQALFLFRLARFREGEGWAMYEKARVERDRGNLLEALTLAAGSADIVESLRSKIGSSDLRAAFFAAVQDCYGLEMDILVRLHSADSSKNYQAQAFAVSERARARVLIETLKEAHADIREGVDPLLLERERTLQIQLDAKETARLQMLGSRHTPEQLAELEKAVGGLASQYEDIHTQIRLRSPHYAALTLPQPLDLAAIQKEVLDPDTVLLEYALGEQRSFLWVVSSSSIAGVTLPAQKDVEEAARRYHDALIDPAAPASLEAGKALSGMLLGGAASGLGHKRLLIVADGALQYLPFAALPDPEAPQQPLVVSHEIVNVPSASTLAVLRRETADRKPAPKRLAILADPVFSPDDSRVGRRRELASAAPVTRDAGAPLEHSLTDLGMQGRRLPRLPGTRREAAGIVALVPAADRMESLDFDASRATLTRADIGQYRILHLATHGLLNSTHPELSGIVLSLVDRDGHPQDGFLRLHEVYNLKLSADLVVLSACQTGLGKDIRGEGLVGLTRGFMYAGAPRVVASLWKVDDRATAELMRQFYSAMLGGNRSPAVALRDAQLSMWKTKGWEAPYYWAAFVLQGDWK